MKQSYEKPEVSVILFENEDIVTASSNSLTDNILDLGTDNEIGFGDFGQ